MPNVKFYFPDEDDPMFSGAFTVVFPVWSKPTTDLETPSKRPPKPNASEGPPPPRP